MKSKKRAILTYHGREVEVVERSGHTSYVRIKDALLIDRLLNRYEALTPQQHQCGMRYIRIFRSLLHLRSNEDMINGSASRGSVEGWYAHLITNQDYHTRLVKLVDKRHYDFVHKICIDEIAPSEICGGMKKYRNDWREYLTESFNALCKALEEIDAHFGQIKSDAKKTTCEPHMKTICSSAESPLPPQHVSFIV